MRIAFVTGSRSDWGLVAPMLRAASTPGDLTPLLIVIGSHLSRRHGHSINAIRDAGWEPAVCVDSCEPDDSPASITRMTGRTIAALADALEQMAPDWVVVTGDRFDAFAAATAATTMAVPLAHVAGGETDLATNIDGNLRNAMTKLAALHFVAHDAAAERVLAMGEEQWRVHTVGLPSLDGFEKRAASAEALVAEGLVPPSPGGATPRPFILASYFPVTMLLVDSRRLLDVWLSALSRIDDHHKLIVTTNADLGADECERVIRDWAKGRSDVTVAASLDNALYLSALKHCDCYVGNSSSGVIESPVFGTPAVIVGARQEGRPRAANVLRLIQPSAESLAEAVIGQIERGRYPGIISPFGDGRASERICEILTGLRSRPDLMLKRLVAPAVEVPA